MRVDNQGGSGRRGRAIYLHSVAPIVVLLCFDGGPAFQRNSDPWLEGTVQVPGFSAKPFGLGDQEEAVKALTARYIGEELRGLNVRVVVNPEGVRSATTVFFGGRDFTRQGRIGLATVDPGNRHRNNYAFVFTEDLKRHLDKANFFRPIWEDKSLSAKQLARLLANIACHELGHTFGLKDGDGGLMAGRMELKPVRRSFARRERGELLKLVGTWRDQPAAPVSAEPVSAKPIAPGGWIEGRINRPGDKAVFTFQSDLDGVVSVMVYASKKEDLYPLLRAENVDGTPTEYVIEPRNPYNDIRIDQKNVRVRPGQQWRLIVADRRDRAGGGFWIRMSVAERYATVAEVQPSTAQEVELQPGVASGLGAGAGSPIRLAAMRLALGLPEPGPDGAWWDIDPVGRQCRAIREWATTAGRFVAEVAGRQLRWSRVLTAPRLADRSESGPPARSWR